jgi:hypothetical protein
MKRFFTFLIICINLITISKARHNQLDQKIQGSNPDILFEEGITELTVNENDPDITVKVDNLDVSVTNKTLNRELISDSRILSDKTYLTIIPKLSGSITLDGIVDESAWFEIDPLPLVTHWPSFGETVDINETQIRIAHDEEYLYVSCICYGNPDKISSPTYKRDEVNMAMDGLAIMLDTFNDNETGLWFNVSASGSRVDAAISNDAMNTSSINLFWNTIWEAEAVITEDGWMAEMRIPFSSIRFESDDGMVEMGLIAYRYSAHNVTMQIYPEVRPDWGFWSFLKPSQSQRVQLKPIESRNPVFITPYVLGGAQRLAHMNTDETGYLHESGVTYEAGLDIKMGITNNTTLDLTINTDFAQVEADDQRVNLTRFSLFFPERRQFFLERASVFDFSFGSNDRLFHSRRIGLSSGLPVRILGGARLISRTSGWDLGLLSMQTARDGELASKNHSILRVRRQVFNPQSYVGGMATSRIDENGNYNLSYGIDGIFRLWGDDFLNINAAQTISSDSSQSFLNNDALRLQAEWQRRSYAGLSYNFSFNYSGMNYDPVMGFQTRQNYMRFGERISWGWQPDTGSPVQRIRASLLGTLYLSNTDGSIETFITGTSLEATWRRGDFAFAEVLYIREEIHSGFNLSDEVEVPAGSYQFPEAQVSYDTPRGRSLRAIISAAGGGFFGGQRITSSLQTNWDFSRVVNFEMFYQVNRAVFGNRNQSLTAHIARFRTELTFNTRLTFSSFIQYSSGFDLGVLNFRLRYNPRDGNNFYIVLNETINTNPDREIPHLPFSENRALMVKYDYTF